MMRARALEFTAPRELRIVNVDVADPREGEIVVRTLYSGISSGTELLAYRGHVDPSSPLDETIGALGGTFSFPFRYGYSCVGVVERSEAEIAPGSLVFALHPHQDLFVCRAEDAVAVADIDPRVATTLPLVETALQITLDAGDLLGEPVVVMGLGAVGLLTSLLLGRAGARVVGADPSPARRRIAHDLDVDAIAPDEARAWLDAEAPEGVALVVEVSGNPDALTAALALLGHEGVALVASWYGTKPVTLPLGAEFHRRRLTIRSTQVSTIPARLTARWSIPRRREHAAALLRELPLKRLTTHEFPFERAPEAFAALDAGEDALVHAALVYEGS